MCAPAEDRQQQHPIRRRDWVLLGRRGSRRKPEVAIEAKEETGQVPSRYCGVVVRPMATR